MKYKFEITHTQSVYTYEPFQSIVISVYNEFITCYESIHSPYLSEYVSISDKDDQLIMFTNKFFIL